MSNPAPVSANPYVGPRSFQKGEKLYGRDRERTELVDLLIAERIVLLYSPSGAGKSSLVNAAVVPELEEQGFIVLPTIRVNQAAPAGTDTGSSFNPYTYSAVMSMESEISDENEFSAGELVSMRLADYLGKYRKRAPSLNQEFDSYAPFVLVFDQLEEIVTSNPTDRAGKMDFFAQIGEALRDRNLWALFIIREDYLAGLDPFLRPVPTRLSNRYRLDLLDAQAAIQAIRQPSLDAGVGFDETAARRLVDELRRVRVQQPDGTTAEQLGIYVEPVQLQVVCRRLWTMRIVGDKEITLKEVEEAGSVDTALGDYYDFQVESVAADAQYPERKIREWIDRKLITQQGIRGQVQMAPGASEGLPNEVIQKLQEAYLVRGEQRGGSTWFELAHDRLIRPIRLSNESWFKDNLNAFQRQADAWNSQGRPDGMLMRSSAFKDARVWAVANRESLTDAEKDFLAACEKSFAVNERERKLNLVIRYVGILAVLLMIGAVYFAYQSILRADEARKAQIRAERSEQGEQIEKQKAQLQEEIANARKLAADSVSNLIVDTELSVLLALQAVQAHTPPVAEAEDALRRALPAMRVERVLGGGSDPAAPQAFQAPVFSAYFSPDGTRLVTACGDGTVKVWEVQSGRELLSMAVSESVPDPAGYGATFAIYSPDGTQIAAASGDGRILFFDSTTGQELTTIPAHKERIWWLAYSPDGLHIAAASADKTATIWDVQTGDLLTTLAGHEGEVQSIAVSPDGTRVATAGSDGNARIWDAITGTELLRLEGHDGYVNAVAFSPDGERVATSGEDRTIRLWDVGTGTLQIIIPGHRDRVYGIAFSADGASIVSVGADRTIRFFDTTYGRPGLVLYGHTNRVFGVSFSPDGKRIATASEDRTVRVWNVSAEGSRELFTISNLAPAFDIGFNADGTRLVVAGGDNVARVWSATNGRLRLTLTGHTQIVEAAQYSPDDSFIVTASRDGTARIWDAASGAELHVLSGHTGEVWEADISPDGAYIATAGADGLVKVWKADSGEFVADFKAEADHSGAYAVAFSPDGSLLAAGYHDGSIAVWEFPSGSLLMGVYRSEGGTHSDIVEDLAFSPDGTRMASVSDDATVIIWNMQADALGEIVQTLSGRGDALFTTAFSPDGRYLITGGADGVGVVWDLQTAEADFRLYGHDDRIYGATFSPNGTRMFTVGLDGSIRAYLLSFEDLVALASKRLTRNFTEEECLAFLNDSCPEEAALPVVTQPDTSQLERPPAAPGFIDSQMDDETSAASAAARTVGGGDDYFRNLYERPFTAVTMEEYYPDVDIRRAELAITADWVFVNIELVGAQNASRLLGNYGLELDLNADGRGDYLIYTAAPSTEWAFDSVRAWTDGDTDVGNGAALESDPPQVGNGYETLVFDQGKGEKPDLAWARINPDDPKEVQIAFKFDLLGRRDPVFMWTAWASRDLFKPAWFDYNDHFTQSQAGSPDKSDIANYPINAIAALDNTCRGWIGFEPTGFEVGICPVGGGASQDANQFPP
ncbi:MAG: hypothetical protein AB1554_06170 [Chloroflexota bacterium]